TPGDPWHSLHPGSHPSPVDLPVHPPALHCWTRASCQQPLRHLPRQPFPDRRLPRSADTPCRTPATTSPPRSPTHGKSTGRIRPHKYPTPYCSLSKVLADRPLVCRVTCIT